MYELSTQQKAAANFKNGTAIVVAIPGSGKTLTMTHRIANLVDDGIAPENILGITFTKNAARTMKERLRLLLDKRASRVSLSTIHSFCYQILRNEGHSFKLLADFHKVTFIRKIIKRLKVTDLPVGLIIAEIGLAKNNLILPDLFIEHYGDDPTLSKIGKVYLTYESEKDKKGLLDFEDLLVDTYQLLVDNYEVRNKYKAMYKHLLIDEYQDTNPIQLEIVKQLSNDSEDGSLFVVGDDSQSIYSFTGATIGNILDFKKIYPTAHEFRLTMNYRSTPQILEACSNLIKHNRFKIDKELMTNNPAGEDVILLEAASEEKEAIIIADEIQGIIARNRWKYKDIAILYRANFQSRAIEETLLQRKIPYRIENGLNFYQRKEVRHLLDYLRVINDPLSGQGDEALLNIINVPNRYLGNRFKSDLQQYADTNGVHILQALKFMPSNITYEHDNAMEFVNFLEPLMYNVEGRDPADLIKYLRKALDYDRSISDSDIPTPDDPKIANLEQLQQAASNFNDIGSFLKHTRKFQKIISTTKNDNAVHLMTIHKSKGMEFPIVFMVGVVDGIVPIKKGEIEEERRIAFVGMSRATKLLHMSYPSTFNGRFVSRSIFIDEISI